MVRRIEGDTSSKEELKYDYGKDKCFRFSIFEVVVRKDLVFYDECPMKYIVINSKEINDISFKLILHDMVSLFRGF